LVANLNRPARERGKHGDGFVGHAVTRETLCNDQSGDVLALEFGEQRASGEKSLWISPYD
jgi:hypothetical protein